MISIGSNYSPEQTVHESAKAQSHYSDGISDYVPFPLKSILPPDMIYCEVFRSKEHQISGFVGLYQGYIRVPLSHIWAIKCLREYDFSFCNLCINVLSTVHGKCNYASIQSPFYGVPSDEMVWMGWQTNCNEMDTEKSFQLVLNEVIEACHTAINVSQQHEMCCMAEKDAGMAHMAKYVSHIVILNRDPVHCIINGREVMLGIRKNHPWVVNNTYEHNLEGVIINATGYVAPHVLRFPVDRSRSYFWMTWDFEPSVDGLELVHSCAQKALFDAKF
jgi:hypothetical protein